MQMEWKNILDLPDDILFVVLLFVAYVPRDILACYQVCKTFQSFLDNVDGSFWRRAFMAAFKPLAYGLPKDDPIEVYLWKKGTYRDPLRSFIASSNGRRLAFVDPTPVPAFPGCLPPSFLRGQGIAAKKGYVNVYDNLKLGETAVYEWRPLYKDFSYLLQANEINLAFSSGCNHLYFEDFRLRFWTLSALPGPFDWLRSASSPVSVDLLTAHLPDILKSLPVPDSLFSEYEVVPVSSKSDFGYWMLYFTYKTLGRDRSDDPSRPFKARLYFFDSSDGDESEDEGDKSEGKEEWISFNVEPGKSEDGMELRVFPEEAVEEVPLGHTTKILCKLYDFCVQRLGSCFFIRPRADCQFESFLVNSFPMVFVSARPESGRLIGLYCCYSDFDLN
jgi:hypothetical protein